jgi:GNAT superfamily N-acetyltransferase
MTKSIPDSGDAYPFVDLALSRRLEGAEGRGNVEFVEARALFDPASGARSIEVAGACVNYDGAGSPLTQSFGLGVFQGATAADLERIEAFYREYGVPVDLEVSPLAGVPLLALLSKRGYHPIELTSVMFRPIGGELPVTRLRNERITVRRAQEHEYELFAQTSVKGWSTLVTETDMLVELVRVSARRPGGLSFFAEVDGRPIATGSMSIYQGVALLAGASTIPEARKQGAQRALLEERLAYAAEHGCDLAMMCAEPGGTSQRNAERQGFRIAYTRTKWRLNAR